jgi:uncharacterized lipoprotein YajG
MEIRNQCFCLAAVFTLLAGCSNEPRQYEVTGVVNYQGQPIAEGQIVFEDEAPAQGKWLGQIKDGRYQLKATAGAKLVRLSASRETGKILDGGMDAKIPERVDILPPQFNTQSQEKRTVEAKEPQTIDFNLE